MNSKLLNRIKDIYILSYTKDPQNIFFFGVFFLIISFEMCQIYSVGAMSLLCYIFSASCLVKFSTESFKTKRVLIHIGYYILMISTEFAFSILIISNYSLANSPTVCMHACIVVIINLFLVLLQCFQLFYIYKLNRGKCVINREFMGVSILACVISGLLCAECVNIWCKWDSYNYYNGVYNLSINNIFLKGGDGLIVCGHISSAYALYSMVIQSITGLDLLNAMCFSNILLMIMDMILVYYIIKKLIPFRKTYFYILCTLMCGFSPYILGMAYDISPELLLLSAIFLLVYGNLYNQRILCLIAVFIMCNTKETGVAIAALMMAASFIKSIIRYYREKKSINLAYYFCILIVGILWLIHYQQVDWAAGMRGHQDHFPLLDGTPVNDFHFNLSYIIDIFKGEFLTNFTWIFLIVFCLVIIKILVLLVRNNNVFWKNLICCLWNYWEIIAGLVGFQIVSCLFITYHLYRYYIPFVGFIYIIGIACINYLLDNVKYKEKICNAILCIITILFFIQSYYTIDFVMLNNFNVFATGNGKVAALDQHMMNNYDPNFTDAALYNRQVLYFDRAFDKSLSLLNPDNNTTILISNEFVARDGVGSDYTIIGFGYQYRNPAQWVKFDANMGRRYLEGTTENELKREFVSDKTDIYSDYLSGKEHVFYIEMPWENLASDCLKKKYGDKFMLYGTVKYRGWELNVYQFTA